MKRKYYLIYAACCNILSGALFCVSLYAQEPNWPQLELKPDDRILVLAPHPDDEAICCAGVIQEAVKRKIPARVAFLTYGDNNQWSFLVYRKHFVFMPGAVQSMGQIRHDEAVSADGILGLQPEQLIFLGYPDFGTLAIWLRHWGKSPAFKNILANTRSVPYKNAFRYGAPHKGEEILKDLEAVIREFKPTKIFVSHPADHNGDHRSLYLFTRVALLDLQNEMRPEVYPYLVHFRNWPKPGGYHPEKPMAPPVFFKGQIPWEVRALDQDEIKIKEEAVKAHRTQYNSSAKYLSSFVKANELFGDFPEVSLTQETSSIYLSKEGDPEAPDTSEELADSERAAFVGIEKRYVKLEDNNLVLSVKFSRPFGKGVGFSTYMFGYRRDTPFYKMKKIHIKLGLIKYAVYDQRRKIPSNRIRIVRHPSEITFYVPLDLLGNPEYVLTSANTYMAMTGVPLDWVSWQTLQLPLSNK